MIGLGSITVALGQAGPGKSCVLAAARQGLQVVGAALSGHEAKNLECSAGISSRSLAALAHRGLSKRET
jgi:predicted ATP-binding protein involved in virulence